MFILIPLLEKALTASVVVIATKLSADYYEWVAKDFRKKKEKGEH